jgi:hypothetical protein
MVVLGLDTACVCCRFRADRVSLATFGGFAKSRLLVIDKLSV